MQWRCFLAKRIIIGLVLTVVFFTLANRISVNRPREIDELHGDLRVSHTTVFEQVGPGQPSVELLLSPQVEVPPRVVYRIPGSGQAVTDEMLKTGEETWSAELPDLGKGKSIHYSFEITDDKGNVSRLPGELSGFFTLKYKGVVSTFLIVLHIIFMFGAFFFMTESFLTALEVIRGRGEKQMVVLMTRWVVALTFIGGWPLGFMLNHQRFGVLWEGFPFGYDITDNKTQLMFVFWLIIVLLSWGSFTGRGEKYDLSGPRSYAAAVIVSFIISLAIFLIPHSL